MRAGSRSTLYATACLILQDRIRGTVFHLKYKFCFYNANVIVDLGGVRIVCKGQTP